MSGHTAGTTADTNVRVAYQSQPRRAAQDRPGGGRLARWITIGVTGVLTAAALAHPAILGAILVQQPDPVPRALSDGQSVLIVLGGAVLSLGLSGLGPRVAHHPREAYGSMLLAAGGLMLLAITTPAGTVPFLAFSVLSYLWCLLTLRRAGPGLALLIVFPSLVVLAGNAYLHVATGIPLPAGIADPPALRAVIQGDFGGMAELGPGTVRQALPLLPALIAGPLLLGRRGPVLLALLLTPMTTLALEPASSALGPALIVTIAVVAGARLAPTRLRRWLLLTGLALGAATAWVVPTVDLPAQLLSVVTSKSSNHTFPAMNSSDAERASW